MLLIYAPANGNPRLWIMYVQKEKVRVVLKGGGSSFFAYFTSPLCISNPLAALARVGHSDGVKLAINAYPTHIPSKNLTPMLMPTSWRVWIAEEVLTCAAISIPGACTVDLQARERFWIIGASRRAIIIYFVL